LFKSANDKNDLCDGALATISQHTPGGFAESAIRQKVLHFHGNVTSAVLVDGQKQSSAFHIFDPAILSGGWCSPWEHGHQLFQRGAVQPAEGKGWGAILLVPAARA